MDSQLRYYKQRALEVGTWAIEGRGVFGEGTEAAAHRIKARIILGMCALYYALATHWRQLHAASVPDAAIQRYIFLHWKAHVQGKQPHEIQVVLRPMWDYIPQLSRSASTEDLALDSMATPTLNGRV
ncbi:hypothetical protein WJX72_005502 [[Myrmecia] bisecta]|uniref:Transposase n=1 Tax=[Myrmecia] bisecta TaxID=41462 RepID=A0AAW1R757_9CHLO